MKRRLVDPLTPLWALVVLVLMLVVVTTLTGCMGKHACDHHGGLSHEVKGIFICNDGHRVGGLSGL